MRTLVYSLILLFLCLEVSSQDLEAFDLTQEWTNSIVSKLPNDYPKLKERKKVLIFSLFTGFDHWTVPHTEAVIKGIAEKSENFDITTSKDVAMFNKENIQQFDAIVLNNNCSERDFRNLFYDVFKKELNADAAWSKAEQYETNLLQYIRQGNGLVVLHGGITMLNKSKKFSELVGGSFDYHPKQQLIQVKLADKDHPILRAFDGEGFAHVDEPYFFDNAYFEYDFKPLLYMEAEKIEGKNKEVSKNISYLAWIKKFGKGRVFYSAPSHNPQSYENPSILSFLLNGLLYATGDLECDDSPIKS
ncbi:ThuA domain-containing protein [Maribacter aurantiacus]|uniref:ThuA domain-containing protein n=1 Tax=Maribacter aurantiacus TaxID=1882343 RepID=A0A5R8LSW7_9FLAO|nr:ThuA domain-containing protein [Maribacter aurantiacus]TLF40334.1 ThuA domain-containing protein [Maribacter aurantiacus]